MSKRRRLFRLSRAKVKARQRPRKLLTTKFQSDAILGVGVGVRRTCVTHDASPSSARESRRRRRPNFSVANSRSDAGLLVDVTHTEARQTDIWLTTTEDEEDSLSYFRDQEFVVVFACRRQSAGCVCVLAMCDKLIKSVYLAKSQASDTWHRQWRLGLGTRLSGGGRWEVGGGWRQRPA